MDADKHIPASNLLSNETTKEAAEPRPSPGELTPRERSLANLRPWKKGQCPINPGRKDSGRAVVIQRLDALLADPEMQDHLAAALWDYAKRSPIPFFKTIIFPLLPQNIRLDVGMTMATPWGSLHDLLQRQAEAAKAIPAESVEIKPATPPPAKEQAP
jgi:hypothetical protein